MPPRANSSRPTEAELEVLQVLWQHGACTVRQVYDALSAGRNLGYTTVLKIMQIMHEKGLLIRDASERSHTYAPSRPREEMQRDLTTDFLHKVFAGSAEKMFMSALGTGRGSPEELDRIRALIDEARKSRQETGAK